MPASFYHTFPNRTSSFSQTISFIPKSNTLHQKDYVLCQCQHVYISANGVLRFSALSPIQYDIMGPFRFVPFMQCRHSVYSMRHRIDGQLTVNAQQYVFNNGIRHVMYCCSASRPATESATTEESTEVKTEKLSLKATPLPTGLVKSKTTESTTDTVYNNWFKMPYNPDTGTASKPKSSNA